jgi:hypothetical protein
MVPEGLMVRTIQHDLCDVLVLAIDKGTSQICTY